MILDVENLLVFLDAMVVVVVAVVMAQNLKCFPQKHIHVYVRHMPRRVSLSFAHVE